MAHRGVHKDIVATRLASLMDSGELHSRVIRDVAAIDLILNEIIGAYFTTPERSPPFTELVLGRLATYVKVIVIESLPYRRRPRSLRHIETLKHFIDARNFLAHTHCLPSSTLPSRVEPWIYLLSDYPKAYETNLRTVRRMLRNLRRTRDHRCPVPRRLRSSTRRVRCKRSGTAPQAPR